MMVAIADPEPLHPDEIVWRRLTGGRRRARFENDVRRRHRRVLLERMDIYGRANELDAW